MNRKPDTPSVPMICSAYRDGDAGLREWLRRQYRRLRLEFDAIDYAEDRAQRLAAKQTS